MSNSEGVIDRCEAAASVNKGESKSSTKARQNKAENMFSFHKPKVYRSTTGCCICKAKSSSSRFTDSKKYEDDLVECFQLREKRTGEICNACVLLVKRWKKLPDGSNRNWRHVVDARAGPGTKSLAKFKAKNKNKKKPKLKAEVREISPAPSDELSSDLSGLSVNSSRPCSPAASEDCVPQETQKPSQSSKVPVEGGEKEIKVERPSSPILSGFIDLDFWKQKKVCCGTVFTGPYGILLVDTTLLQPCRDSVFTNGPSLRPALNTGQETAQIKKEKAYSDTSSDSGYDETNPPAPKKQNAATEPSETVMTKPESATGKPLSPHLSQPPNTVAQNTD